MPGSRKDDFPPEVTNSRAIQRAGKGRFQEMGTYSPSQSSFNGSVCQIPGRSIEESQKPPASVAMVKVSMSGSVAAPDVPTDTAWVLVSQAVTSMLLFPSTNPTNHWVEGRLKFFRAGHFSRRIAKIRSGKRRQQAIPEVTISNLESRDMAGVNAGSGHWP